MPLPVWTPVCVCCIWLMLPATWSPVLVTVPLICMSAFMVATAPSPPIVNAGVLWTSVGDVLSMPAGADVREVVQRCDVVTLPPLRDVPGYLRHRFRCAGIDAASVFEDDALDELRQRLIVSRGGKAGTDLAYPLAVANLATRAMNLAASIGEPLVTADVVRQVKA